MPYSFMIHAHSEKIKIKELYDMFASESNDLILSMILELLLLKSFMLYMCFNMLAYEN